MFENRTWEMAMPDASADLAAKFAAKVPQLIKGFTDWFAEEEASIDGTVEAQAPTGSGGSIISARPAIDSKRVLDATCVTEEVLGIKLPAKIIKPGGYASCEEMVSDLVPKLEQAFIASHAPQKGAKIKVAENA
jgi:hypothetical protein